MKRLLPICMFVAACLFAAMVTPAAAQQVTVGTPFQSVGDGFYENIGVGFNFGVPGGFFSGGGSAVVPPFGGFNPAGNSGGGFGVGGSGFGGGFGFNAEQGSTRGITSTTPMVTLPNGGQAFIADTFQRPFVTSFVPVVGGFAGSSAPQFNMYGKPMTGDGPSLLSERMERIKAAGGFQATGGGDHVPLFAPQSAAPANNDPLTNKLHAAGSSSAGQPASSVAAIRAQQAAADAELTTAVRDLIARGRAAQYAGKANVAKLYLEQAVRRAMAGESATLEAEARAALEGLPPQ